MVHSDIQYQNNKYFVHQCSHLLMDKSCHRVDDTGIFVEKKSGRKMQKKIEISDHAFSGAIEAQIYI